VQWLVEHGCPCDVELVAAAAAGGGHVPVLAYLRDRGMQLDVAAVDTAVAAGQHAAADWLRETLGLPPETATSAAAKKAAAAASAAAAPATVGGGIAGRRRLDEGVALAAISKRRGEALKWLLEAGCPCDARA
ncbi:unnamed protein product, partial [Phaeothamnion confervicola]